MMLRGVITKCCLALIMFARTQSVTVLCWMVVVFVFQAEDGIRDLVRSRGLGDVYKRQQQGVA